jgi:CBS domain-containing protein
VTTTNVKTVDENAAVEGIVELMERYRIKRVPAMSGSILIDIVTRSNLMHAMVSIPFGTGCKAFSGR